MRPRDSGDCLLRLVKDHQGLDSSNNAIFMIPKKGGEGVEGNLSGFA